jgi:hypothetical protein
MVDLGKMAGPECLSLSAPAMWKIADTSSAKQFL